MAVYHDSVGVTKKKKKTTEAKSRVAQDYEAKKKKEEEEKKQREAQQKANQRRASLPTVLAKNANSGEAERYLRQNGGQYGKDLANARSMIPGAAKTTLANEAIMREQSKRPSALERNPYVQTAVSGAAAIRNQTAPDAATAQYTYEDYTKAMRELERQRAQDRLQEAKRRENNVYRYAKDYSANELSWMQQAAQMGAQYEAERAARSARDPRLTGGNVYQQQNADRTMNEAYRRAEEAEGRAAYLQAAKDYRESAERDAVMQGRYDRLPSDPSFKNQAALGKQRYERTIDREAFDGDPNEKLSKRPADMLVGEKKEIFYAIYAQDPQKAQEYAEYTFWKDYQAEMDKAFAWAGQNPLTRGTSWELGRRLGQAAGFQPFTTTGRMMAMMGQALSGGSAQGLQEHGLLNMGDTGKAAQLSSDPYVRALGRRFSAQSLAGTLPEDLPVIGGKGLADVSQLASSMLTSYENAMLTGAFGMLGDGMDPAQAENVAKVGEAIGLALMGSSAAASDYAELMAKGVDQKTAMLHATAAGVAEAAFEKLSLENIIHMRTDGGLKQLLENWFVQAGVEASEETFTTMANRVTDEIIMDTNGYYSAVQERQHELLVQGVPYAEAKAQAEREWLVEILNDALGGFISGGGMTAMNTVQGGIANIQERIEARNERNTVREWIGSAAANEQNAELQAALDQYAKDNKLKGYDQAQIEQVREWNRQQSQQTTEEAQSTAKSEREVRRETARGKKAARNVGKVTQAVLNDIEQKTRGKVMREYEADLADVSRRYKGLADTVRETAYNASSDLYGTAKSVRELDTLHKDNVQGVKNDALRQAAISAYNDRMEQLAPKDSRADARWRARQAFSNGALDLAASYGEGDGHVQTQIDGITEDGKKVKLANGEVKTVDELELDADTRDILTMLTTRGLGSVANNVLAEYQAQVKKGDLMSGYGFATDFIRAVEYGRTNQKLSDVQAALKNIKDKRTVEVAWKLGREQAQKQAEAGRRSTAAKAQTGRKASYQTVEELLGKEPDGGGVKSATGRKGSVDVSRIKGMQLDAAQRAQVQMAKTIARAIGVDVSFFASEADENGRYHGAQGSYRNGVIELDINAGRLSTLAMKSGILKTMSHELTHFIQDYSSDLYQELKDYAFRVLGEKEGVGGIEELIDEKVARSGDKISRPDAEDEVIADAMETMLGSSEAVKQLYAQNATLADKVLSWLADFMNIVKAAIGPADHREAKIIDELDEQMRKVFQDKWDTALADAANRLAASETGNEKTAREGGKVQNSERDSAGRELSEGQREFFKDSKVRDDDGQLLVMYHGTTHYGDITKFKPGKTGWLGPGIYLTSRESDAQRYADAMGPGNGTMYQLYANVTNPLIVTSGNPVPDVLLAAYGKKSVYDARKKSQTNDTYILTRNDIKRLQAKGYDGILWRFGKSLEVNVFGQNQIKRVDNQNPTDHPDIRYSERDSAAMDEAYLDAVKSGDMNAAQRLVDEKAKAAGWTIHAYHGTSRADRVGTVFRADRATSGPMAYFTSSKEIADHYAKDKRDTSLAYDTDYDSYETQFRAKTKKGAKYPIDTKIEKAWGYIDITKRNEIREKAGQLRFDWDGEDDTAFILDKDNKEANGGFQWQLKEARGNVIKALIEQWLNSGNLFDVENRFLDVLKMVGITDELKRVGLDVEYKDPEYREEKTYDVYLKMTRPFHTSKVNNRFIENFLKWADKQPSWKYNHDSMSADMWDKNDVTAEAFAERLRDDLQNKYTHAWTSVPDVVTDYLKHLGYDGIQDTGGKFHPESHTVYIPFSSEQIKSAEPVVYDDKDNVIPLSERFNESKADIRYSERDESLLDDRELAQGLTEKDAQNEEQRRLLRDVKAKDEKIKALEEKLADARRELKTTERRLNTKGIPTFVQDTMRQMGITDANHRNLAKRVTGILTDTYEKALADIDNGKGAGDMLNTLYDGASQAVDAMIRDGTYTEQYGYGWVKQTWEQMTAGDAEGRQNLVDELVGYIYQDFAANRYREAIKPTAADRLVEKTAKQYQEKLDKATAQTDALTQQRDVAQKELALYKRLEQDAMGRAKGLEADLAEARASLKAEQKDSKAADAKIQRLEASLKDARSKAKKWQSKAEHGGVLARQMAQSKNRDIRDIRAESDKALAGKTRELEKIQRDLEKQIQREKDILSGKLRAPQMVQMLKQERERVTEQKNEQIRKMRESRKQSELMRRIRNLREDLQRRILRPTDRTFVPPELAKSLVTVLDTLDLSPKEGTKAAEKYEQINEAVRKMADAYYKLKNDSDEYLSMDFEEEFHDDMLDLADKLEGRRVQDLNSNEMREVYDTVRRIRDYLRDTTKLIGKANAAHTYDYGDRIIADEQQIKQRKDGKKAAGRLTNTLASNVQIDALSPMRAVKMIGGWSENSALYELWRDIEDGNEIKNDVVMESNKTMQPFRTGKNEKTYLDALRKKLDFGIKDTSNKTVRMTKLQAIQLYMTWQREANNEKLAHLQNGFASIRDADLIAKGKSKQAAKTAQNIKVTPEMIAKIERSFTEWDKGYIKAARDVFHRIFEDSNKVQYALRHTVMQGDDYYIPISVDKNYLTVEPNNADVTQIGVKNPGSTKPLENRSGKPIIIDGLDVVLHKHVSDMSGYIGLAVPIRNFVKVWNVSQDDANGDRVTVKSEISAAWGDKANDMMMETLKQIQNMNSGHYATGLDAISRNLNSAFAKSALVGRPSVVIKQAASYAAAGSVLKQSALDTAQAVLLPVFLSPNSKFARNIYERADRLTSELYMRRLGMSMVEIAQEKLRTGPVKRLTDQIGASLEQNAFGRVVRRASAWLNPGDWIQRMDVATTTALFVACEHQAKSENLKPNTDAFDNRVRELYNQVITQTQPMYDPLYRNQLQKSKAGSTLQAMFPFKTVPFQNYGQIMDSIGSWQEAMRSGDKEQKKQASKHMAKTMYANFLSALVFAGLTILGNGVIMHKMKKWRDDDEELTAASLAAQYAKDVGDVMLSNLLPYGGSELKEIVERLGDGGNKSYFDVFSIGTLDLLNDTAKSIFDAWEAWGDKDASMDTKKDKLAKMVLEVTTMFGLPIRNMVELKDGIAANIRDIQNGNFPALNNDVDRSNSVNAKRYYEAMLDGDKEKAAAVLAEMRANTTGTQKEINQKVRNAINDRAKEDYKSGEMDLDEYISFLESTGLWEPDALAEKAVGAVKELYNDGKLTEDEAIDLLGKYKGMDEDEAWFKVQEWEDKAQAVQDALDAGLEADQAEDVSSSDYRHVYDAIDANKDIGDIVDELVSHGKKRDDVIAAAKGYIVDKFEKGVYNERQFKELLARHCKITKTDEVNDILTKAKCFRETGYRLSNISTLYREGDITGAKAKDILQKYGGMSKEDADKKIRWYDLEKANPDLDISEANCNNWYDGTSKSRENGHEGAKAAGMSIEAYLRAKQTLSQIKDTNDNGTGEDEYIAALAKMNLPARQKDALYYEKYKGTTKYSNKKW